MMNKIFYFLLFCSISGAGVLWWLMHSMPKTDIAAKQVELSTQSNVKVGDIAAAKKAEDAEEHAEEASEKAHEEVAAKEEEKSSVPFSTLLINSEPSGADVFLEGEKVGVTPYQGALKTLSQKFRFELKDHVPVERESPAETEPQGALMNWNIKFVKETRGEKKKEAPMETGKFIEDVSSYRLVGPSGPSFVQVKAVDENEPISTVQKIREDIRDEKVFFCKVNLGDKGLWNRILVGPFASKSEASRSLPFLRQKLKISDPFVTGAQQCL